DYTDQNAQTSAANLEFVLDKAGNVSLDVSEESSSLVFVSKKQDISNSDDNLSTDARFNVTFISKEAYLAPIANEVVLSTADQHQLVLKSAHLVRPKDLRIKIKIKKKGFLGIGRYKFEKELTSGQFTTTKSQDFSFVDIDFDAIGAKV